MQCLGRKLLETTSEVVQGSDSVEVEHVRLFAQSDCRLLGEHCDDGDVFSIEHGQITLLPRGGLKAVRREKQLGNWRRPGSSF